MSATASAVVSQCGFYRYALRRTWTAGAAALWIMLNPSTADGAVDDPTIRRVVGFSRSWGFGEARVVNLFAWRTTDPRQLLRALDRGEDVVGPDADRWIEHEALGVGLVVAAWGGWGRAPSRKLDEVKDRRKVRVLGLVGAAPLRCLGFTIFGAPRHPLYVKGDTGLVTYPSTTRTEAA